LIRTRLAEITQKSTAEHGKPADLLAFPDWALRVPEPKTGHLNFDLFPFQRELYADGADVQSITVMKSTQVGASAWAVRLALYWPAAHGLTALYLFPAEKQMNDFSKARIAPLLRSKYLSLQVPTDSINNVFQRQVGHGWLYLRGTQSQAGLESIDADAVVFDEYDLMAPESIEIAGRRLSSPLSRSPLRQD